MQNANEGATPDVDKRNDNCCGRSGKRHNWLWLWIGTEWTNNVRCGNCGEIEERDRFGNPLPKEQQIEV